MKRNKSSFSGLAAGIFIGGILGTVAAMLFALRKRIELSSIIPESDESIRQLPVTNPEARKDISRTAPRVKPDRAWRVIFYVASGIAMFADSKIKRA